MMIVIVLMIRKIDSCKRIKYKDMHEGTSFWLMDSKNDFVNKLEMFLKNDKNKQTKQTILLFFDFTLSSVPQKN